MKKIWERIKAAWQALVAKLKRLLKLDAPQLKWDVGGRVYINGAPYIIVGINMDMRGHVDFQVEPEAQYYAKLQTLYEEGQLPPRDQLIKSDRRISPA